MTTLDEKLRRGLERIAETPDGDGVVEGILRRAGRAERRRRAKNVAIVLVAVVATAVTYVALVDAFGSRRTTTDRPPKLRIDLPVEGRVAYESDEQIVVARGGVPTQRLQPPAEGWPFSIEWSPTDDLLAVSVMSRPPTIWVLALDGRPPVKIAEGSDLGPVSWSPDGKLVTYPLEREGVAEIHVARADGTQDVVVHSEPAPEGFGIFSSVFSPDGTQIAFDAGIGHEETDIYVMDADGSNVRRLTHTGMDAGPSWSPDGRRIVFVGAEGPMEADVFLMDANGLNVERVTSGRVDTSNISPKFSPDGRSIVYHADRWDSWVQVDLDGRNARVLLRGAFTAFTWSAESSPTPQTRTIPGIDGKVCDVTSVEGQFFPSGELGTAYVFEPAPEGGCDGPDENFQYLAVAGSDGIVVAVSDRLTNGTDAWGFRVVAAPDVDGDGISELAIDISDPATEAIGFDLYRVQVDQETQQPKSFLHLAPGCHAGGCITEAPDGIGTFTWGVSEKAFSGIDCGSPATSAVASIVAWTQPSDPNGTGTYVLWDVQEDDLVERSDVVLDYEPHDGPPPDMCGATVNLEAAATDAG